MTELELCSADEVEEAAGLDVVVPAVLEELPAGLEVVPAGLDDEPAGLEVVPAGLDVVVEDEVSAGVLELVVPAADEVVVPAGLVVVPAGVEVVVTWVVLVAGVVGMVLEPELQEKDMECTPMLQVGLGLWLCEG